MKTFTTFIFLLFAGNLLAQYKIEGKLINEKKRTFRICQCRL